MKFQVHVDFFNKSMYGKKFYMLKLISFFILFYLILQGIINHDFVKI